MNTTSSGLRKAVNDKDYRHGLVSAQIDIDLPFQLRRLRMQRGWTQPELAERAQMRQPRISAMEKPGGAHFTLETLRRLAEAFDVALIVRFAPFGELLEWSERFNPETFSVPAFDEEFGRIASRANLPIAIGAAAAAVAGGQRQSEEMLPSLDELTSFGKIVSIDSKYRRRPESAATAAQVLHGHDLLGQAQAI